MLTGSWASPEPLGVAGQGPHGLGTPPFCLLWKDGEHPTRYGPQTCSFLLCLHLPFCEMGIILCSFPRLTGTHAHRALVEVAPGRTSYIECSCQLTGPLCLQPYKPWGLSPETHHGSTYPSSPTLSPPQAHLLWHKGPGSPQLSWAHRACSCCGTSP